MAEFLQHKGSPHLHDLGNRGPYLHPQFCHQRQDSQENEAFRPFALLHIQDSDQVGDQPQDHTVKHRKQRNGDGRSDRNLPDSNPFGDDDQQHNDQKQPSVGQGLPELVLPRFHIPIPPPCFHLSEPNAGRSLPPHTCYRPRKR